MAKQPTVKNPPRRKGGPSSGRRPTSSASATKQKVKPKSKEKAEPRKAEAGRKESGRRQQSPARKAKKRPIVEVEAEDEEEEDEGEEEEEEEYVEEEPAPRSKGKEAKRPRVSFSKDTKGGAGRASKRAKVSKDVEDEAEGDAEEEEEAYGTTVHRIRLDKIKKRWQALSVPSQGVFQGVVEESVAAVVGSARTRSNPALAQALSLLSSRIARILPKIRVPASSSAGFSTSHRNGVNRKVGRAATSAGQVDVPSFEGMQRKVERLEEMVREERALVQKLSQAAEAERRALKNDEAELADFEKKRRLVEREETKEMSKKLHPTVQAFYEAETTQKDSERGAGRASRKWVAEAAAEALAAKPLAAVGNTADAEEDDDEPAYDPKTDAFLAALTKRLLPHLLDLEKSSSEGAGEEVRTANLAARRLLAA